MLECALADVAAVEGGELVRGDPVMAIRATPTGWLVTTQSGRNLATDLLVDATGAARISLSLLEADLPDVALDDLGSPQGYVSWRGRAPGAETWLLAWGSAASLEGLIQSTASGRIRLTCRHGAGAAAPETPPLGEIMESGGDEMARMLGGVRFESKAVRYWAPAARRIALDEMPVTERPLPVLVGDALVQTPPRFGEGIRQALNHAERLGAMLSGGTAVHGLARELALDARRVWLGAGLATPPTGAV